MKEEFLNKYYNKKYISNRLYENLKNSNIISNSFDIDNYNNLVLENEYLKYKDYFENMYNDIDENIHLDKEQIKTILADEDYLLVLAGAGTGKTTTITSKVKYLVDIKKVNPSKILIISYTKKAVEELVKRININLEIPAKISTFHSIGYEYIKNYFKDRKCYIVDENLKEEIFLKYFKEYIFKNKSKLRRMMELFDKDSLNMTWVFSNFFCENNEKFNDFDEYFKYYKKHKILEVEDLSKKIDEVLENDYKREYIHTIKNELVKSKGEAIIANYLFTHNIDYKYEKIYKEYVDNNKIYRPDFTLNIGGEELYIEYFGLSNYKDDELNTYNKIKNIKIEYHKQHNNKFISIDCFPGEDIIKTLEEALIYYGFNLNKKTDEEIYDTILNRTPLAELFPIKNLFYDTIQSIKSSKYRKNYKNVVYKYINNQEITKQKKYIEQFQYILDFYIYYQKYLFKDINEYGFDFEDMLYYSKECILRTNDKEFNYEYLIIDEYQDVSFEKYSFAQTISNKNNTKITAVGDDWQTIFSYSGSKISYIYNFKEYFKGAKVLGINKTYRNSQELINYTGNFIMKNNDQIKKKLISDKNLDNPIKFVLFDDHDEISALKKVIKTIHNNNKDHNILILARRNSSITNIFRDSDFIDEIDTKVKFMNYEDLDINAMTIHKSKGLTADEVIIIGLDRYFPSFDKRKFWLIYLFSNKLEKESIEYAEERRIFYVALTRTKNYVYLLVNKNPNNRSIFINEIYSMIKDMND